MRLRMHEVVFRTKVSKLTNKKYRKSGDILPAGLRRALRYSNYCPIF